MSVEKLRLVWGRSFAEGKGRKLYTKSGHQLLFDPYAEKPNAVTYSLDIPRGKRFQRKLVARFKALRSRDPVLTIVQIRAAFEFMSRVKREQGPRVVKQMRVCASQLLNGFRTVVGGSRLLDRLKEVGISYERSERDVKIECPSLGLKYSFRDDYYFTGTKVLLQGLLREGYDLGLVDQRARHSVVKVLGGSEDQKMYDFYCSGEYSKAKFTKFWGGSLPEGLAPIPFKWRLSEVVSLERSASYVRDISSDRYSDEERALLVLEGRVPPREMECRKRFPIQAKIYARLRALIRKDIPVGGVDPRALVDLLKERWWGNYFYENLQLEAKLAIFVRLKQSGFLRRSAVEEAWATLGAVRKKY